MIIFVSTCCFVKVTEKTVEDLNSYFKALDWAMMNYHKKRMEQINTIIRDLWRKVYSGNDIDTIEIKTEQEETVSGMFYFFGSRNKQTNL